MDNCSSLEPWSFRPAFPDTCWFSDAFARDNEVLTRALQISLSDDSSASASASAAPSPSPSSLTTATSTLLHHLIHPDPSSFQIASKRGRNGLSSPTGKIAKRKPRVSKRSPTTYIAADPADFRRMVQQVTGVRVGGGDEAGDLPFLKPEPQRIGAAAGRAAALPQQSCLPTLDTSAFLLDRVEEGGCGEFGSAGPAAAGGGAAAFEYEPFPSFPTLESWSVM